MTNKFQGKQNTLSDIKKECFNYRFVGKYLKKTQLAYSGNISKKKVEASLRRTLLAHLKLGQDLFRIISVFGQ